MSRQNRASSDFFLLRAFCERRLTRFRNKLTKDLTLTARYNDDLGDDDDDNDEGKGEVASGRGTDDLTSAGPNENEESDGIKRGGSKDTWNAVCEARGCAIVMKL